MTTIYRGGQMMQNYCVNDDVNVIFDCDSRECLPTGYRYPNRIDLRDFCLPTNDQGITPHCVGYSVAGYFEVHQWKLTHIPIQFDASKIYNFGRKYKADSIAGTKPEYCINQLIKEKYISGKFYSFGNVPVNGSISDIIRLNIHSHGCFIAAFNITDEWYSLSRKNVIKIHKKPKILGGHCVLCCGYDLYDGLFIQNSWGYQKWGNYGFAIVPWEMVERQFSYGVYSEDLTILNQKELWYGKRTT